MCLRFVFLLVLRFPAWLRLAVRTDEWKHAEILLLRHQIAVLQRQQPDRVRLSWAERALMAALLALIPRAQQTRLTGLVTPGTILRWHRDLVRRRWAEKSRRRPGRPRTHRNITRLVLRMARENEHWSYRRVAGELAALGIRVAPSSVWEVFKRHGVEPAPRREGPGWAEFLRSQAQAIVAMDLFTVDLLDGTKAYVLAAIEHATRRVRVLGSTMHPGGDWIVQQARNLSDASSPRMSGTTTNTGPTAPSRAQRRSRRCRPRSPTSTPSAPADGTASAASSTNFNRQPDQYG